MNISNWILKNTPLYDIKLGDALQNILKKINLENYYLVGNNSSGYYYNNEGYRFGFSNRIIDEIGVDLLQTNDKVVVRFNKLKINLKTAKIHKVLAFLNDANLKWVPIHNNNNEILIIKLEYSKIFFFFDVYEGTLDKISKALPVNR